MIETIEIIVEGAYALLICLFFSIICVLGIWCAIMCLVDDDNRITNAIIALICFIIFSYCLGLYIV